MYVVDPLRLKILKLLRKGLPHPLHHARMKFGSPEDYRELVEHISGLSARRGSILLMDLTPFERLGVAEVVRELLTPLLKTYRVLFLCVDNAVLYDLTEADLLISSRAVVYGNDGNYLRSEGGLTNDPLVNTIVDELMHDKTLMQLRRRISHRRLLSVFGAGGVDYPIPGLRDGYETVVERNGRFFFKMPSGVLISAYINMKPISSDLDRLTVIAYEVIYHLFEGFRAQPASDVSIDTIVVAANTALLIGSAIQMITDMPVVIVDKLGPIPSSGISHNQLSASLEERRVCLLVDVTATGAEIDRAILFLSYERAKILSVIACYNLQVGGSMLAQYYNPRSLCEPKHEIGYVYRSE